MDDDTRDAIYAACSTALSGSGSRRVSFERMRRRIVEFLRGVPEKLSAREIRAQLED